MGLVKAGALWLKDGKRGKFMSGEFEPDGRGGRKIKILVFRNKDKEDGSKYPDYTIHVDDGGEDAPTKRAKAEAEEVFGGNDSEVPF